MNLRIVYVVLAALVLSSCEKTVEYKRPHDPWVFRSVMDQQPRMITIALDQSLYVSYNTANAALYKSWKGGVKFDGAVYTTVHGPQPTSEGYAFFQSESIENTWKIKADGKEFPGVVTYKGHEFMKGHVRLKYELSDSEGHLIKIIEQPEIIKKGSGVTFERSFEVVSESNNIEALLPVVFSSMENENNYEVHGDFKPMANKKTEIGGVTLFEVSGMLHLKSGNSSVKVTYHLPSQDSSNKLIETGTASRVDAGKQLIESSDCKSCHNETVKTVGPSYQTIAERYRFTEENERLIASKIQKGGSGSFGEIMMTPHPDLSEEHAREMTHYILSLDKEEFEPLSIEEWQLNTPSVPLELSSEQKEWPEQPTPGVAVNLYKLGDMLKLYDEVPENYQPVLVGVVPTIHVHNRADFGEFNTNIYVEFKGSIHVEKAGSKHFRLVSDDGSKLFINGKQVIDNDGYHGADPKDGEVNLKAGANDFKIQMFQGTGGAAVSLQWTNEQGEMEVVPASAFTYSKKDMERVVKYIPANELLRSIPGDQHPLNGVHPSFSLHQARPDSFKPKVGGMDFLSDGRMVVCTWDSIGPVYLLDHVNQNDPSKITVKRIAEGLAEPLGLKVINDTIYVLQKQELTMLLDHNNDEVIDEYKTVANQWKVSGNFHEFAFGLAYQDGYFYGTLATAIMPGGASAKPQIPDRGKVLKIAKDGSSVELIANGLRTPNGIGEGFDGELFVADNEGDWLPSSKILRVRNGAFYGSRSVDFEGTEGLEEDPPVVWLPQNEIGNSPSQPVRLNVGPYKNQMLHGEVTHGGLKRVFVEKVGSVYQGAVFRFTQGLEAGINRSVWGPDGSLYVGGVGSSGNWGHEGGLWYGLQRLTFEEDNAFEMLTVKAKKGGFELEFTQPINQLAKITPEVFEVSQWYYLPTENYGGPKMEEESLKIVKVHLSENRKTVFLELDGLKEGHVVNLRIKDPFISENQTSLWTTEAWYTLNKLSTEESSIVNPQSFIDNSLTEAEKQAGWELLFDGKSTNGWRNFNEQSLRKQWVVEKGELHLKHGGGKDLVLPGGEYENFELKMDWKLEPNGNSGLMFNVVESEKYTVPYVTGPEMQMLDNDGHPDGRIEKHRSGDLYDMIKCQFVTANNGGEWNSIRLVINNGHVEHWQNGYKVVEYQMFDDHWNELIANSKFKNWEGFGMAKKGLIVIQDHDNELWVKNIKIKKL